MLAELSSEVAIEEEMQLFRAEAERTCRSLEYRRSILQETLVKLLPKGCSLLSVYRSFESVASKNHKMSHKALFALDPRNVLE